MKNTYSTSLIAGLGLIILAACSADVAEVTDTKVQNESSGKSDAITESTEPRLEEQLLTGEIESDRAVLQQLLRQMRMEIGTATAEHPNQCILLPVGEKPCGGPERFLLYSEQGVRNETLLIQLSEHYTELSRVFNRLYQNVSDCQVLTLPALTVRDGMCVPIETAAY